VNAIANPIVLGEDDNRRFSYSEPHKYRAKYRVPDDQVQQQLFPNRFEDFVEQRSVMLADARNSYARRLGRGDLRV
jgi:hypothetical protein